MRHPAREIDDGPDTLHSRCHQCTASSTRPGRLRQFLRRAFRRVLDEGAHGVVFPTGDAAAAAAAVVALLRDPVRRAALAAAGQTAAARYDWSVVAAQVLAVYETVQVGAGRRP
ncbi:MAG: hypothetical protein EOO78_15875 [Oxalobacteraceae bacterium]|nr:MAG: hypothetical protein EOO78_15875 [Oxalobacteraceae bacterium]